MVNGVDGDITLAIVSVNDGEPLAILGHRYVRRYARQGYRLVEQPALAVSEEYRDGLARENCPYTTHSLAL